MRHGKDALKAACAAAALAAGLASACAAEDVRIVNSEVPARLVPFVSRLARPGLPGKYQVDDQWSGAKGEIDLVFRGGKLFLETRLDLSGRDCGASAHDLGSLVIYPNGDGTPDADAPVDGEFKLEKGRCTRISGDTAEFHFNKTIFGSDVYLIDILIDAGHRDSRGGSHDRVVQRWSLKKIQ